MMTPGWFALLFKSAIVVRMVRIAWNGLLGLMILSWVVDHAGPPTSEAVVHVVEPDVEVSIGGNTYRIEARRFDPIVCKLPPGQHELIMSRGGRILYRESFETRRGESVVLTAWNSERLRKSSAPD